MLRFRPNLVIEGSEAYAEDGWKRIRIGDVEFRVVKSCALHFDHHRSADRRAQRRSRTLATLEVPSEADGAMFGQNLVNDGNGRLQSVCR
jgi:uncharacterized protein YcbX